MFEITKSTEIVTSYLRLISRISRLAFVSPYVLILPDVPDTAAQVACVQPTSLHIFYQLVAHTLILAVCLRSFCTLDEIICLYLYLCLLCTYTLLLFRSLLSFSRTTGQEPQIQTINDSKLLICMYYSTSNESMNGVKLLI